MNDKKTKWASVPINQNEFIQKGYTIKEWEKYQKEISTNGIIYVRREIVK